MYIKYSEIILPLFEVTQGVNIKENVSASEVTVTEK
jgi:hypothetical protein